METQLTKRIPWYVIHKHIIPYTYHLQPKHLLMDIRSFNVDYSILNDMYHTHYTSSIMYHDLQSYCRNNYTLSTNEREQLQPHLTLDNPFTITSQMHLRRSRRIWGRLTPLHRTEFINKYILEEEDEMFI